MIFCIILVLILYRIDNLSYFYTAKLYHIYEKANNIGSINEYSIL